MPCIAPVEIVGIRHHSPACARLVARRIRQQKPAWVLIEGPADFNPRIDELFLPHTLPLAIYSFCSGKGIRRASWSPFAEYSPEWQALQAGREVGANLAFIDLPAWHDAFADIDNRYADVTDDIHERQAAAYEAHLSNATGVEGRDALWDHLFEGGCPAEELALRLAGHFANLRGDDPGSPGNRAREEMMARWIAWAAGQCDRKSGGVLVVCGGYHAPALARLWPEQPASAEPPATPEPEACIERDEGEGGELAELRHGSYLVPYTNKRLDALHGYASGMPSPAFHQAVWADGADAAGRWLLQAVLERLRQKKLPASTADLLAIHLRAHALAALRGHAQPLRNDWLDALAGSLVREAQDAPLPWSYRGPLRAGTAPVLVEVMDVLAGPQAGRLAAATPQPPLILAVAELLRGHDLSPPQKARKLDLLADADRLRSRVLHCLRLLDIPGFVREVGPDLAISGDCQEIWQISAPFEQQAALIEASVFGATLVEAAGGRLEEALGRIAEQPHNTPALTTLLNQAALAGLSAFSQRALQLLLAAVRQEGHFEALGEVMALCHGLYRHGQALGMAETPALLDLLHESLDRALWLCEDHQPVPTAMCGKHLATWQAMRHLVRDALALKDTPLGTLPVARAHAVWARKAKHPDAAALSRGAALGCLISIAAGPALDAAEQIDLENALALLGALPPATLGDAVQGLLAVARHELADNEQFIKGANDLLAALDDLDFVLALPALRAAFAWLPPRERAVFASRILALHGVKNGLGGSALTAPIHTIDPTVLAANRLAEKQAADRLRAWGLLDESRS